MAEVELGEFLRIPKTDGFNDLQAGMLYSSYLKWANFMLPGFSETEACYDRAFHDDFKFYTNVKIGGRKDLQSLFYLSVAEAGADNVKTLYGGIDLSLCEKCGNPAEFAAAVDEVKSKFCGQTEILPVLILDNGVENNLFLAETFIESGKFAGVFLCCKNFIHNENAESYAKIFSAAKELKMKTEIDCIEMKTPEEFNFALETFKPDFVKDAFDSICDEKSLDFIKQQNICAEFSPYSFSSSKEDRLKKYRFMRKIFDSGVKIRICTASLLFLKSSLSQFAAELCNSGIFRKGEVLGFFEAAGSGEKS